MCYQPDRTKHPNSNLGNGPGWGICEKDDVYLKVGMLLTPKCQKVLCRIMEGEKAHLDGIIEIYQCRLEIGLNFVDNYK